MNNPWLHTDQSYTRNYFECVQSWVTSLDVNENDATLAILEKSHKYHKKCAKKFNITDKADWYRLTPAQEKFYVDLGCECKKIMCPAGSLVLWDSRTVHFGSECMKNREKPNLRSVVYLCYAPRSKCSAINLKKKQKAFKELRSTSHYLYKVKLFSKKPNMYGKELLETKPIKKSKLTKLGLKLAGF